MPEQRVFPTLLSNPLCSSRIMGYRGGKDLSFRLTLIPAGVVGLQHQGQKGGNYNNEDRQNIERYQAWDDACAES